MTVDAALDEFASWKGRSTPFTDLAPRWAQLARSVAIQYDPTQLIIEALERLDERGINPATINAVVREACRINQPLAVEVFITQSRREDVLTVDGDIDESVLTDPTVYNRGSTFSSNTTSGILDCSRKVGPTTRTRFYRTSGRSRKRSDSDCFTLGSTHESRW